MLIILLLLACIITFKIICMFPFKYPKFQFNPSSLSVWYGAPGVGKSTLAAFFALKAMASGIPVYSNMPIVGAHKFEKSDLGRWNIENCLVLWDEVG